MPVRAVAPAHSPSSSNRFLSPGVDAGDYLYILENVVYVHVYLADMTSYPEMNRVFGEYFPKAAAPARAVLGV